MLLSSAGHPEGPIPPETRRVAALLAREKTGEILTHLFQTPYLTASEIARLESIHVATAQRYLKELAEAGLLGCRVRTATGRPTEEYWLLEPRITIQIDLDHADGQVGMLETARRIAVRDRGPTNVVYETNPRSGDVEGLLILSVAQPRRVEERIRLSAAVGRFLAHLAAGPRAPTSVWDTMRRAGLGEEHLPEVLGAVDRFSAPSDGTNGDRPLEPTVAAVFRALAARHDRAPLPLAEPIFDLLMLPPATAASKGPKGGRHAPSDTAAMPPETTP